MTSDLEGFARRYAKACCSQNPEALLRSLRREVR
jgi:hypothetical protein